MGVWGSLKIISSLYSDVGSKTQSSYWGCISLLLFCNTSSDLVSIIWGFSQVPGRLVSKRFPSCRPGGPVKTCPSFFKLEAESEASGETTGGGGTNRERSTASFLFTMNETTSLFPEKRLLRDSDRSAPSPLKIRLKAHWQKTSGSRVKLM